MKIGVFDSGIGGMTVLREMQKRLTSVDFVYLGDTAHVPYGTKSVKQIEKLSLDCARLLKSRGVSALVVACNTVSSTVLPALQEFMHPAPVFGVIEPGVNAVLGVLNSLNLIKRNPKKDLPILILATRATVRSEVYSREIRRALNGSNDTAAKGYAIFEQACPLLVPIIEEGWIAHPILEQALTEYLSPYQTEASSGIALLGCTHYPWIQPLIEKALPGWIVVNSAKAVCQMILQSPLWQTYLENGIADPPGSSFELKPGDVEWIFTDPEVIPSFAKQFMYRRDFAIAV